MLNRLLTPIETRSGRLARTAFDKEYRTRTLTMNVYLTAVLFAQKQSPKTEDIEFLIIYL